MDCDELRDDQWERRKGKRGSANRQPPVSQRSALDGALLDGALRRTMA
jgi:hypothetical protein